MKVTLTSERKEVTQVDAGDYTGEVQNDPVLLSKPRHRLYQSAVIVWLGAVVRSRTIKEGEKEKNERHKRPDYTG